MSKSAGGSVNKQTQNSQTGVDETTMAYMKQIMDAARAAGQAGPSPLLTGAAGYNTGMMKAGNLGMGALSGDQGATDTLMNPYLKNVVGATNAEFDNADQHTMNAVNDRATAAGAFGGSRHGVATGTALGENNRARTSTIAGLLHGGYNDAMTRAGTLASGGFAGAGANANLGFGGVGNAQQWLMNMLNQGFHGPTGTTSSGTKTDVGAQTEAKAKIPFFG